MFGHCHSFSLRLGTVLSAAALTLGVTVGAAQAAQTQRVLVFAAASLSEALHAVADAFTAETGISVAVSYGGTAIIARQIEQGAPADIFISADGAWMNYVADRGLIDPASRTELLGNSLVLIAPAATDFDLGEDIGPAIRELIGPGRLLAMANIGAVPAGRYGKTALETLGVWSDIARFIAQADSVRGALAFVARAETPLGIVYATDAAAEPRVVAVATFASELHPPIIYPAAITRAGNGNENATRLFDYLTSPEAASIFSGHGFLTFPAPR